MEYRNRTSSNPSGIFSRRSGDLYEPYDGHQARWTAHLLLDGARRPNVPSTGEGRTTVAKGVRHMCRLLVPGRINGGLDITL